MKSNPVGHTPTPWHYGDNYLIGGTWIIADKANPEKNTICDLVTRKEDASFIVQACNSHELLVDAVRAVLEEFKDDDNLSVDLREYLKTAIAKAEPL